MLVVLLAAIIAMPCLPADATAATNDGDLGALRLEIMDGGVGVRWPVLEGSGVVFPGEITLAKQPFGGRLLPMQTFADSISDNAASPQSAPGLSVGEVVDEPWAGELVRAPALVQPLSVALVVHVNLAPSVKP